MFKGDIFHGLVMGNHLRQAVLWVLLVMLVSLLLKISKPLSNELVNERALVNMLLAKEIYGFGLNSVTKLA